MNYAQWNAQHAKESNNVPKKARIPSKAQRMVFNEPILKAIGRDQTKLAKESDKSLPFSATVRKILAEDDRQLDLLSNRRMQIFQQVRQNRQSPPLLKGMLINTKKNSTPATTVHNTQALQSPYDLTSVDSDGVAKQAVIINQAEPHQKPVHQKAQLQKQYNRMKEFLARKESNDSGAKIHDIIADQQSDLNSRDDVRSSAALLAASMPIPGDSQYLDIESADRLQVANGNFESRFNQELGVANSEPVSEVNSARGAQQHSNFKDEYSAGPASGLYETSKNNERAWQRRSSQLFKNTQNSKNMISAIKIDSNNSKTSFRPQEKNVGSRTVRNRPDNFEFVAEPLTKHAKMFNHEISELRKQEEELIALQSILSSRQQGTRDKLRSLKNYSTSQRTHKSPKRLQQQQEGKIMGGSHKHRKETSPKRTSLQLQTQLVVQNEASLPLSLQRTFDNRKSSQEETEYDQMNIHEGLAVPFIEPRYSGGNIQIQKVVALEMPTIPEKTTLQQRGVSKRVSADIKPIGTALSTITSPYLASMPKLSTTTQGEEGGTVLANAGKSSISLSLNPQLTKISLKTPHKNRISRLSGVYSVKGKTRVSPPWLNNEDSKNGGETERNSTTGGFDSNTIHASQRSLTKLEQERQNVENRVKYLAAEEQKYRKQIEQTKKDIEKRSKIKQSKIDDLQLQILSQRENQMEIKKLTETIKNQKNQSQAKRLKNAYENMLIFEEQRQREKKERQTVQQQAQSMKMRDLAVNFQKAQIIRQREMDFSQAKFFKNELTKLLTKEQNQARNSEMQQRLVKATMKIDTLEKKEIQMLESLQGTLNEHQRLNEMSSTGSLRIQSGRQPNLDMSQRSFKAGSHRS